MRSEGYRVEVAGDGPAGVELCEQTRPDLVVLDLMLPGLDGHRGVPAHPASTAPTPVLMLTARDSETDLLVGLGVGADDYMTKPFSARELVARVGAILRRSDRVDSDADPAAMVRVGEIELDTASRRVRRDGELVHLTPTEFDLLVYLASRPVARRDARRVARTGLGLRRAVGRPHGRLARAVDAAQARFAGRAHGARCRVRGAGARTAVRRPAPERPLDQLPTLKLKLSVVILAAVAVTVDRLLLRRQDRALAVGRAASSRAPSPSRSCGSSRGA